jgi:hypothetical protein
MVSVNIPDVTISLLRYTELVQKEKMLEKIQEYVMRENYISKEMMMFLADLELEEKGE